MNGHPMPTLRPWLLPTVAVALAMSAPVTAQAPRITPAEARTSPQQWSLPEVRRAAPVRQPSTPAAGRAAAAAAAPCQLPLPPVAWKPAPLIDPPSWQAFVTDLDHWLEMIETLDIESDLTREARELAAEVRRLRADDEALERDLGALHATLETIFRDFNELRPRICAHDAEIERFEGECLGRALPDDAFAKCAKWQAELNQKQAPLDAERRAFLERHTKADAQRSRLSQQQDALRLRVVAADRRKNELPGVATAAARRRKATGGYEIDTSSFIQLAEREPEWPRVERVLVNNRGRVFIAGPAEAEVMSIADTARLLTRRSLLGQWNIRKAAADVPQALAELFANLGVPTAGDAEIAASAWKHRRILLTADLTDFRTVTCPNFPCLSVELTK